MSNSSVYVDASHLLEFCLNLYGPAWLYTVLGSLCVCSPNCHITKNDKLILRASLQLRQQLDILRVQALVKQATPCHKPSNIRCEFDMQ